MFSIEVAEDVETAIGRVLDAACARNLRLVTAESCTGGLIASLLTDVEGRSHAFDRGYVVYTEAAKTGMLGVPADMLAAHGAVSEPVATAMARGALTRSEADIAFAVTGFAGPAGDGDEEGLVHFACARRRLPSFHREAHYGPIGRGPVRLECVKVAMSMILEQIDAR
jgi:nicotinamide-nucleotide amidase